MTRTAQWKNVRISGGFNSYALEGETLTAYAYSDGGWAIYGPPKENGDPHDGGETDNLKDAKVVARKRLKELEQELSTK